MFGFKRKSDWDKAMEILNQGNKFEEKLKKQEEKEKNKKLKKNKK